MTKKFWREKIMRCPKITKYSALLILAILVFSLISFSVPVAADVVTPGVDSDGDGLSDTKEETIGTNATNPDTDNDGLTDGYEVDNDLDPLEPATKVITYESSEDLERDEKRDDLLNTALFTFLMAFAVFALLAGAFTAYFGAGKSRAIGSGLMVLGLIVILVWVYFGIMKTYPDDSILKIVHWEAAKTLEAFVTVIAALIGAVAAIGLFLIAIMKS
jgi:hypothetical protein